MKQLSIRAFVLALGLGILGSAEVFAQQTLNSDPINVDGYLDQERPVTDGELEQIKSEVNKQKTEIQLQKEKSKNYKQLAKTTEKLSETTEEYLEEKDEATETIAEYNKKIKCLMDQNPGEDCDKYVKNRAKKDEVVTSQASTQEIAAAAPEVKKDEMIKFIPYVGATQYNGQIEQLEAELSTGIRIEYQINPRFSMGIGLNYNQLKTQDFATGGFINQPWFGNYNNFYGVQGREIEYRSFGLDIYGKFFLLNSERFKPYVGAGLGYNRARLNYSQNDQAMFQQFQFGNEGLNSNFMSGQIMAGSEINITNTIGVILEGSYSTGIGSSQSNRAQRSPFNSPDQLRLQQLGDEIVDSNALSLFLGMVINF